MQIKSIEPFAVSLPMKKPVIMAGEEVRRADNVLVRIVAADGAEGWGEAASAPVMTGETLESIVTAVHYLTPVLHGRDPRDIDGALAAMDGRMYGNHGAKAAIEIALHDLAGHAAATPVHALLGQKVRQRMPLLGVIGGGDLGGDLVDAGKKKTEGFTAFKIAPFEYAGIPRPSPMPLRDSPAWVDAFIQNVASLREAIGKNRELAIHIGSGSYRAMLEIINAAEQFNPMFFEIHANNYEYDTMADIAKSMSS